MARGLGKLLKLLSSKGLEYAYVIYGEEVPSEIVLAQASMGVEGASSYLDENIFTNGRLYYKGRYEDTTVNVKYYGIRNATWAVKVSLENIDIDFCGAKGATLVVYGDKSIAERLGKYLERKGVSVITPNPG